MTIAFLFLASALAQTAPEPPYRAWVTEDVELRRFSDSEQVVAAVNAGQPVEVLVVDGPMARVRKEATFGWMPAEKLSATEPSDAAPVIELGKGMPKL